MSTIRIVNFNCYNLVRPGVGYYSARPYSNEEADEKIDWTAATLTQAGTDLVGFQEIFHIEMLHQVMDRVGGGPYTVLAPGATREENERMDGDRIKAGGPKVGLATRFKVLEHVSINDFPNRAILGVPTIDPVTQEETLLQSPFTRFNRPVLKARVELPNGVPCTVFVAHLKSKRPMLLEGEERNDPAAKALGAIRSLLLRGSEAAALRCLVLDVIDDPDEARRGEPVIVMGDLNDDIGAVSTQAVSGEPPWYRLPFERKKPVWDVLLYNVQDIQARASLVNTAYTHIYNGRHEVLDHIMVSQELVRQFPAHVGYVLNARIFNDHLVDETLTFERKTRIASDHGIPSAEIRLEKDPAPIS